METRTRFVLMIWVRDDEIVEEDVMDWKLNISIPSQGSQVYLRTFFKVEKSSRDLRSCWLYEMASA